MQLGALAGILFPISSILLLLNPMNFGADEFSTDAVYIAALIEHNKAIQYACGLGLLSVVLLLMHVEWLTELVSKHAPFSAKVAKSGGLIAAIGASFTFGLILVANYGADQKWPDQVVRTTGLLGGSLSWTLSIGLGIFASVIAFQGWKGHFPKWIALLATIEAVLTVVSTGVGAPGVVYFLTMIWLAINAVGLLFHERKSS